jgi:hypothetical protein
MEVRSWVWLINSRCLCHSRPHSHLRIQRGSRPSSVWETNEATEEVIYESDSREGGQEEGEEKEEEEETRPLKQRLLSLALALSPEGVALVALRTDLLLCLQVLREISAGSFSSQ